MSIKVIRSLSILTTLLLVGCSHVHDRTGTQVNLYPVDTALALQVNSTRTAIKTVTAFIDNHKQQVLSQNIQMHYQGHAAKRVMQAAKRQLLAMGVDQTMLTITASNKEQSFSIALSEYKVKINDCRYVNYNSLSQFDGDFGCNVEKNRWMSMTHPERSASITESGK